MTKNLTGSDSFDMRVAVAQGVARSTAFVASVLLWSMAFNVHGAQAESAGAQDFTAEEVTVLAELEATLASQHHELDAQLEALIHTTDPAARQTLQTTIDSIQHDIAELTRLRDELQAPVSSILPPITPAAKAAETLQRQLDKQERRSETIHDDRPPPSR